MSSAEPLARLTRALAKLPGIGRRSAERMALRLVTGPASLLGELVEALEETRATVVLCKRCGNLTVRGQDPCALCADPRRATGALCVVEEPGDLALIEKSGGYRGRYHVLHGKLSPMKGQGVEDLRVPALLQRVREEQITEVILALNADTESDATASFLQETLAPTGVRLSRLGSGIPAGSGLAYVDPLTVLRSMEGRQPMR